MSRRVGDEIGPTRPRAHVVVCRFVMHMYVGYMYVVYQHVVHIYVWHVHMYVGCMFVVYQHVVHIYVWHVHMYVGGMYVVYQHVVHIYPPPLSFPALGKTVPHQPLGDGHQVTVPHPPLGNRTTTIHAHLQAQELQQNERIQHKIRSKGCQCTETYSLTGSV